MTEWKQIARHIGEASGSPFQPGAPEAVGGGCINTSVRLQDRDRHRRYFVKLNRADLLPMFEAEAAGLKAMAATLTIRVPLPLCTGVAGDQAYLVMEDIRFGPAGDSATAGRQLAAMHHHTARRFGWERDNTIGSTPQPNDWNSDWIAFWRQQRLGFQLQLAADHGHRGALQRRGALLLEAFPALIDHDPRPSLIHGDLWGGNIGYDLEGKPVIYDPAVYYGDREAEIAMTELFGGPGPAFLDAYREAWPLDAGYPVRRTLYNLYHILNHLNLFGGGYGGQALNMIDRLLAELGH